MNFSSKQFAAIFMLLAIFAFSTTESAIFMRNRRAIEDYYNYQVVNNLVNDRVYGGPTSLGWAQVPHTFSPMFSPVFGR